jgi:glycine/D-amino acid oxidase-like deaminating enzyme
MVFGTVEGDGFGKYKIGNELNEDPHLMLKVMKVLFPTKIDKITHVMPCFYSNTENEEFIFERKGNTIYGFGLCGRGFKHMTYHGKRIYHLIKENYQEADKYKAESCP